MAVTNKASTAPSRVSSHEAAPSDDTWRVMTKAGIVSMTLDELDMAFQRGEVDAGTRVFTSGMHAWETLGSVANLDDASGEAPRATVPPALPTLSGVTPEPPDQGSFPPTTRALVDASSPDWLQDQETARRLPVTGVRRRVGRLPFALRRAPAALAERFAALGVSRRRLATAGLWSLGAALSVFFITLLYRLGGADLAPTAPARNGWISARTTPAAAPRAAAPLTAAPATPLAAAPDSAGEEIAVVRPIELRLAPTSRAERLGTARSRQKSTRGAARVRSVSAARATRESAGATPRARGAGAKLAAARATKKAARQRSGGGY